MSRSISLSEPEFVYLSAPRLSRTFVQTYLQQPSRTNFPRRSYPQSSERIDVIDDTPDIDDAIRTSTDAKPTTKNVTKGKWKSFFQLHWWRILLGAVIVSALIVAFAVPLIVTSQTNRASITAGTTVTTTTSTTTTTTTATTTSTTSTSSTSTSTSSTSTTSVTTTTTSTSSTTSTSASTTTTSTTTTTTTTTTSYIPAECLTATVINDPMRSTTYTAGASLCDSTAGLRTSGWFRFVGAGGTTVATVAPAVSRCGGRYPGWHNGALPAANTTITGRICYNLGFGSCSLSNPTLVTNCNGYYVYNIIPLTTCPSRVCTQ